LDLLQEGQHHGGIAAKNPNAGDCWLWVCLDADTKAVIAHMIGPRWAHSAYDFMKDVASRIQFVDPLRPLAAQHRVQITTDGYYAYPDAAVSLQYLSTISCGFTGSCARARRWRLA